MDPAQRTPRGLGLLGSRGWKKKKNRPNSVRRGISGSFFPLSHKEKGNWASKCMIQK